MIRFNGSDFTDVAPVKIEDIVVSPIALNPVEHQRAIRYGSEFVRMSGGTRTVTVTFALLDMDAAERETYFDTLRSWAQTDKEQTIELPQFSNRHLECICTSFPQQSYRKWWESNLTIVWTCYNNPYWTSNELIEVPCGTTFSVGGSAPPQMIIERKGNSTLTNVTYTNGTEVMHFTRLPSGTFTVDLNRQTAAIGNTSVMQYYEPTSTWIIPKIGANQYINGQGTVKYRERWI